MEIDPGPDSQVGITLNFAVQNFNFVEFFKILIFKSLLYSLNFLNFKIFFVSIFFF